ncbi:MAG: hypothetical protein HC800_09625 [Phormidesmis sp. RL_2_1]|nr:hypothetical protein [Phormidesmis sp. RL_2_1]
MQSFREKPATFIPEISMPLPLSVDFILGLATLPLLALLASGPIGANHLKALGQASEELFRGDRLPPLPLLPSVSLTEQ